MRMFNIRVYGVAVHQGNVLVCREPFQGYLVTKFPGGGLEFGEGPEQTLIREMMEETGQSIELLSHLYTTGFFVASLRDPREQLISIYYRMTLPLPEKLQAMSQDGQPVLFEWLDLNAIAAHDFDLPADRFVAEQFLINGAPRREIIWT